MAAACKPRMSAACMAVAVRPLRLVDLRSGAAPDRFPAEPDQTHSNSGR